MTKTSNDSFSALPPEKSSKRIYWIIGFLVVIIAVLALFLFRGKGSGDQALSPQMKQMQETVSQIQGLENDIQEKQNEVFTLMADYKNKTGKDIAEFNIMNLSPEQKQLLEEKIRGENDTSIKSLLQDILDKNNEIKDLNGKVQELEGLLPKPVVVEKNQNHYQLAMDYLVNEKGIDKKKAMELIERSALFDPLMPGFKVWNFYANGEYGTFITQGTAPVSPNQMQRKVKKALVDARDKAIAERDQLQSDIELLENRRGELISQLDMLNQEKERLITNLGELNAQNEVLQKNLNSVYYIVDTNRSLLERGIIKSGFLRSTKLQSVMPEEYTQSLDLRKGMEITVSATDLGIEKVRNIRFFPNFYQVETDYSVEIAEDKLTAKIKFLNDKKFRSERVVISVN